MKGLPVKWRGYFIQERDYYPDGDDLLNIVLVDETGNSCEEEAALWEELSMAPTIQARLALWAERRTALYWSTTLFLRVWDANEDLTQASIQVPLQSELADTDTVRANVLHQTSTFDEDFVAQKRPQSDYEDRWESDGGSFEITLHEARQRIAGSFETEIVVDNTSESAGSLQVHFDVERCRALEASFF